MRSLWRRRGPGAGANDDTSEDQAQPRSLQLQLDDAAVHAESPRKQRPGQFAIDLESAPSSSTNVTMSSATDVLAAPYSPRNDAQLGGYPPDCGTKEHKFLSYAKVLHERGRTHPMSFSTTEVDAVGNAVPENYPLSVDFGAHSFHRLPTDSLVLSQYGVGMSLYFKYLKVMTWLFFILVILSTPAIIIYIVGGAGSLAEFKVLAKQNLPMVLGMTTIGHLKESSNTCDQVLEGNTLSLACPAGEIGFIKAVYSARATQGSCTCPEINKVAEGNGQCRGKTVLSCSGDDCTTICPKDGYGCFMGQHPISKWSCCAKTLDPATGKPNFDDIRIRSTPGCDSSSIQTIVNGLCLGKKSCSFNVSEALTYKWKVDDAFETFCPGNNVVGTACEARITDESDFSKIDLSNERSLKIIGWDSISRKDFLGLAVGTDILCSVLFFCVVLWMKGKEKEDVARIAKGQIKAMDYTVQLVHLPRHTDLQQLRKDIRDHLESLLSAAPKFAKDLERIRIADIQFGKSTSGHLELLRARGVVIRKLEAALQRLEKVRLLNGRLSERSFEKKHAQHLKITQRLEKKLERHNVRIEQWFAKHTKGERAQAVTAFITFEEEEGFHRCLTEYPDLGFVHRLFQPSHKRLHGKRLRFRPAPDPTDIVWENLHHPFIERVLRQVIVALVTLTVLFLSFILILLAKLHKTRLERQFGRPSSCPVGVKKEDVVEDEHQKIIGLVPYKALVECYCKQVLAAHSYSEMTKESFFNPYTQREELYCQKWATSFVTTQVLSVLSVLMVVSINVLLARILNVLVIMEKHHTQTAQVVSRVTKVFLAQFFNTALLLIIINANLDYFFDDPEALSLDSFPILNGKYSDFSPGWYMDVGVSLILTMIINTFSPHVYVVFNYLLGEAQRFADRSFSFDYSLTRQDTQRDLEAFYRGPQFDLAYRYAQSLTTIFITYLFSAGMPLLHLVGFMQMIMTYWADKFTFLRIARSPPLYDAKVANAAGALLPYAVILHSLVGMWMFSNEMIFQSPSDIIKQLTAEDVVLIGEDIPSFEVERGNIFGRVTRPQVAVLFGFFIAFGFLLVLRILLFDYFPSVLQNLCPSIARVTQKPKVAKGIPSYYDAIPTSILREKASVPTVKEKLRAKYVAALEKRGASLKESPKRSPSRSPRRRTRRTISAAEHYNDESWIVGCPSYAIRDNKEYVDQLAIDSHLSETLDLDQVF
ncbi:hypothetical protein P43SY_002046 [Pythium insidiosum]|uniref:CSC1/OSCA1-like cytosolic domain-containing protein n=1 Tax=Pythium insidiosum TaxID=114742 RepID=A0AAD5LNL2_PYTIN|nr:hypothetical protein P43SY_002046 [Pythium insidiosum]